MKKVVVQLSNCYGIGQLDYAFDFRDRRPYSIYAPNGFMKTSLSKTFRDLSNGQDSKDVIFPDRLTTRVITDESGSPLTPENVFVVEPYDADFSSDRASSLLVNEALRREFELAVAKIEQKRDDLLKRLKQLSGLTGRTVTPETELLKRFGKPSIYEVLESLALELTGKDYGNLGTVVYSELFNERTISFLESGQIRAQLHEYITKYDELIQVSPILNKSFNHYHAKTVQKNLAENGFFAAKHTVRLYNGQDRDEIGSAEELDARIEAEKARILSNPDLQRKFDAIDKKLTNADLRKFRDYLFDNRELVSRLADYPALQKDLWLAYLSAESALLTALLDEYRAGGEVIRRVVKAAKEERTDWEQVVRIFNSRFSVPFVLRVDNQDDVILKGQAPRLSFDFKDSESSTNVTERGTLLSVLSQGEKRALYLLNILFEIEVRRKDGTATVVIVDDIADSFDYRNKYAIVEYLREVAVDDGFRLIFLSHNYDFHRTICSRLFVPRAKQLAATRQGRGVELREELYQNSPFKHWRSHLDDPRYLVASIPFVRNLAEYGGWEAEEVELTKLLHLKPDTHSITVADLLATYSRVIKNFKQFAPPDPTRPVLDLIVETADALVGATADVPELESKVVLSMAIRLKAERHMLNKLGGFGAIADVSSNQTWKLTKLYKESFAADGMGNAVLDQVNLMTPENIHINSFMYEPILDMSAEHLKGLYQRVSALQ